MSDPARAGAEEAIRAAVPDAETLIARLDEADYLADEGLATAMFLSLRLPQPLLLEGEAGVGKTEAASAGSSVTAVDPICGMTVVVAADTPSLEHDGGTVYFCCSGCRRQFEERREHARSDG